MIHSGDVRYNAEGVKCRARSDRQRKSRCAYNGCSENQIFVRINKKPKFNFKYYCLLVST